MAELVLDLLEADRGNTRNLEAIRARLREVFITTPTLEEVPVTGIRMWTQGVLKFLVPSEKESGERHVEHLGGEVVASGQASRSVVVPSPAGLGPN